MIEQRQAPSALSLWVSGFVHRDDASGGRVVHELPELRPSIQLMLGDPYWLRERKPSSQWRPAPRIGVWGPRYEWGYGFAKRCVKVFAIALTPTGVAALTGAPVRDLANQVAPLDAFNTRLAQALDPAEQETFEQWRLRVSQCLLQTFDGESNHRVGHRLDDAIHTLATNPGGAIRLAASRAGLSERQFRRLFSATFGISPKHYQQLLRVDRMLRQLHPAPWETDAFAPDASIPFADQPHATREFRRVTGLTPSAYLRSKRNSGDRVLRSATAQGIVQPPEASDG